MTDLAIQLTNKYLPNITPDNIFTWKDGDKVLGIVAIYNNNGVTANMQILKAESTDKLFKRDFIRELYNYIFDDLSLERIHCIVNPTDKHIINMLEKFGFICYWVPFDYQLDCIYHYNQWFSVKHKYKENA